MWHQAWPHNDLLLLKTKTLKLRFLQGTLDICFVGLKNVKDSQFWCHFFQKKIRSFLIILFMFDLSTLASQANFHCNFFWFLTILAFCWSLQIRHPHRSRLSSFFMAWNWICFLKLFDLICNCAFFGKFELWQSH